jgi:hypothetical protein
LLKGLCVAFGAALLALLAPVPAARERTGAPSSPAVARTDGRTWSQPAFLGGCPARGAPRVLFPSDAPDHASGPGAVLWDASPGCPGGEGARVSAIGPRDVPAAAALPRTPAGHRLSLFGPLALAGAPHGEIVIAGARAPGMTAPQEIVQGPASGAFSPLTATQGSTASIALATAYLGDVASASLAGGSGTQEVIRLQVERHFAHRFAAALPVSRPGAGRVEALTVALDYRSDALAVWSQAGAIYARDLPAAGARPASQRLAGTGPHPVIAALLSDDNRAIVAWAEQQGGQTSVYLDRSGAGVRFGAPKLLERFFDPTGLAPPSSSPRLVRLSSESVMMAWAGAAGGHWVVRSAAIDLRGVGPASTISMPGGDALLADLAPGPDGEALLLWTEPAQTPSGLPDSAREAIFAARGTDDHPDRTRFGAPEEIAAPAENSYATVAFDPDSDRALAVWQGEGGQIAYSIRTPSAREPARR